MIPGNINTALISGAEGGYEISRSLRFNSADSAYLSRTPSTAGNRKTWTWSGWVKRSALGGNQTLFATSDSGGGAHTGIKLTSDQLQIYSGNPDFTLITTQVFRDASAWAHILIAFDTTQATASDRVKVYFNGLQVTTFSAATYPAQNTDYYINQAADHAIGRYSLYTTGGWYASLYLADIHFIDGQALTPSSFAETNATTGQWVPKTYSGTYGTNGFRLNFSDNSAATATTLGKDRAGSNNWTPNNLSVTAGAGNDSLVDTPTSGSQVDTGLGGQVTGNYCTANPLAIGGGTLSNGNLDYVRVSDPGGNTAGKVLTTIATNTGKWYFEYTVATSSTSSAAIGITSNIQGTVSALGGTNYVGMFSYEYCWRAQGQTINNGSYPTYGTAASNGDIIMCAFDVDAGKIWFGRNGTWFNSSSPSAGTSPAFSGFTGDVMPIFGIGTASAGFDANGYINFGQRPFAYTAPSGFKALCDTNLPAPTIVKPSTVMDVKLYTGNGSAQTISGLGFSPDLVWIKQRSAVRSHWWTDTVRGNTKLLSSDQTIAEITETDCITAFNSDGFSLDADAGFNANAGTYAAWCWDAGSTTVTNTQGSITSSVRANPSAGFSVVTWVYNSSSGSIGHGLGVEPHLILQKDRTNGTYNWDVYHVSLGATKRMILNNTNAAETQPAWNNTSPTSTLFYSGSSWYTNGDNMVSYCFTPVAGYSAMGSFVANGSSDGPAVWLGFRPRWVMLKCSSVGDAYQHWHIFDTSRSTGNISKERLQANSSAAEDSFSVIDLLSSGFKLRYTDAYFNQNGATYVYAAFAESPFAYSRAR